MNKNLLRCASLALAFVLAFGHFTAGRATSQNAGLMPDTTVNLAFFYKPPSNSDAATVASYFSNVVLTGGDENFRDQLISNGFASPIPQYYRSEGIQDPGSCTANPSNNQIAYKPGDFCDISKNHPDWFLLDTNGNRMRTSPNSNYWRMDPGNAGWSDADASLEQAVKVFIYNHLTEDWDPVPHESVDADTGSVTFRTKVLGLFQVAADLCPMEQLYGRDSKEVRLLRNFRDRVLSSSPAGEFITRLYYEWSPYIAAAMKEDAGFKRGAKAMIDGMLPLMGKVTE